MSAEKIVVEENNLNLLKTPEVTEKKLSGRVDINELLARVREEKKKENKVNVVFLSLFASLILIVGIILSF
ncbi:hypothetical protein OAS84_01605 [Candidatus Pelagibacter sp.]|jgi:hypothetical protein|nr:hypothetical protein [Candidatus Pelagibacter sp.]|tara:strand:- start:323 stop:535 length:213 start_codon:yes stop_codon:yes gene_type:complete